MMSLPAITYKNFHAGIDERETNEICKDFE